MQNKRVALGMSGGVDSSLAAHLLVEQGYQVTGVYLECWRTPGCRTEEDRKDALTVALGLNIPFQVLDFKQEYKDTVVEYFFREYQAGRTPNPDILCNKEIKFGLFYDWAMNNGFEAVATGHYAQVNSTHGQLLTSADGHKDQTYFLHVLNKEQLKHTIFPIGHLTKSQVRAEAAQRKIAVADKKDSVGICFIGDINVHQFLKSRLGLNPGEVIDTKGNVLGKHQGLWFYTVGQRHGFEIKTTLINQSGEKIINKHIIPPFYVIKKIPKTNQLVVGFGAETYSSSFKIAQPHWIDFEPNQDSSLLIRIRHTGQFIPGTIKGNMVNLGQPIQGIAEGQSAVFYQPLSETDFICLGGAVITS